MANRKITSLVALAAPATDDVLPIIDISETGNDLKNKKITYGELFKSLPDGSNTAPALAFNSSTTTGIYRSAVNELSIATNGGQAIKVESNNKTTIYGDLVVTGGTTTISSTTIDVADKNIQLATGNSSDTGADGGGLTLKGATNKTWNWVDSTDAWTANQHIDVASGKVFKIAGTQVLSATTLGSGVVNSSLTSVGTLGSLTVTNAVTAGSLDISGGADIDGTLEADAYTVNGTALNEYIADTVGAMVSSNTETNIVVTYNDSDNTLDFVISSYPAASISGTTLASNVVTSSLTSVGTLGSLNVTNTVTANLFSGSGASLTANTIPYASLVNIAANRVLGRSNAGAVEATQVQTGMIADDAVTAAKIADNTITAGQLATNCVNHDELGGNAVATINIIDSNVTTAKIADSAITSVKIADGAIVNADINASAAISLSKLATGALPNAITVTSANISDLSLVNADVSASAAIAGTKISPDFGSQNIITTGTLGSGDLTITGVTPQINFTDSNNNPDFYIQNNNGAFRIYDSTNSSTRFVVNADGHVDVIGNLDVGAGVDVTGAITSTGNITVSNTSPALFLTDTNNNSDYSILNNNGIFNIKDETNTATRFYIEADGSANFTGNLDCEAGLDVTGAITATGNLTISNTAPKILLTDTDHNDDFSIRNDNGTFKIYDETDGTGRLKVYSSGTVEVLGNLDVGAGLDVTGNITTTGEIEITGSSTVLKFTENDANPDFGFLGNAGSLRVQDLTNGNNLLIFEANRVRSIRNFDAEAGIDVTGNITVTGTVDGVDIATRDGTAARKDGSNMGTATLRTDDADFIVQDSTDGTTNFIWRDHSAGKLYLGTDAAVVHVRSHIGASSDSSFNIGSSSTRFANIYGDNIFGDGSNLTSLPAGQLTGTVAAARLDTATTQSAGNNSTKIATTAFVSTAVTNLIGGAPGALDTLNELAAAINDDSSYASTVTTALATKLPLAGGTLTGALSGTTFSGTHSSGNIGLEIHGTGSGTGAQTKFHNDHGVCYVGVSGDTSGEMMVYNEANTALKFFTNGGSPKLTIAAGGAATFSGSVTATGGFSGSGASLTNVNATTLDSIDSGSFLRSDAADSMSAKLTLNQGNDDEKLVLAGTNDPFIRWQEGTTNKAYIQWQTAGYLFLKNQEDASGILLRDDIVFTSDGSNWNKVFHGGNDGAGSGLDADLLDGQEGSYYRNASNLNAGTVATARLGSGTASSSVYLRGDGTWAAVSAGSATTLGGLSASQFVRSDASDLLSGAQYTFNSTTDEKIIIQGSSNPLIRFREGSTDKALVQWHSDGYLRLMNQEDSSNLRIKDNIEFSPNNSTYYKMWNASNDGGGSGLDADMLYGIQGSNFVRGDQDFTLPDTNTWILYNNINDWAVRISNTNATNANVYMSQHQHGMHIRNDSSTTGTYLLDVYAVNGNRFKVRGADALVTSNGNTMWHAGNDGSGSGLDADLLDGINSGSFIRNDTTNTVTSYANRTRWYSNSSIDNSGGTQASLECFNGSSGNDAFMAFHVSGDYAMYFGLDGGTNALSVGGWSMGANSYKIWHQQTDGAGSGLDADTLDGQQGDYYRNASNLNAGTYPDLFSASTRYNIGLIDGHNGASYDKLRVWNSSSYTIGMHNAMTYGWLNDYAMTFTMNNDSDRGFVWRHTDHGQSGAAMSLSTNGNLNVANAIGVAGNTSNYFHNGSWGFRHTTAYGYIEFGPANAGHAHIYTDRSNFYFNKTDIRANGNTMWHAGNDGSGSGLDADLLDGYQASQLVLNPTAYSQRTQWFSNNSINTSSSYQASLECYNGSAGNDAFMAFHVGGDYALYLGLDGGTNALSVGGWSMGAYSRKIFHEGNDGAGSGLDADTVDGVQASSFVQAGNDVAFGSHCGLSVAPGNTFGNRNAALCLGDHDSGIAQNGDGQIEIWANNQEIANFETGGFTVYKHTIIHGGLEPNDNGNKNLGASNKRWANLYVNDMHFSNEGKTNSVDGTWGDWTLQEGEDNIFMINNRSGKKYRMALQEVS